MESDQFEQMRSSGMPDRITVALHTTRASEAGDLASALTEFEFLRLLPPEERDGADVVVVLAELVTDAVVDDLSAIAEEACSVMQRIVLVAGPLRERHLLRIFGAGVVSILPYHDATPQQIIHTVVASCAGRSVVPDVLVRRLIDEIRSTQSDLLARRGSVTGNLDAREIQVLSRLAEGHSTARIALDLKYSERTIKKIIQGVTSRLNLRNRAHAVSYATRVGAI